MFGRQLGDISMILLSVPVIFGLILGALAYRANMRFRSEDRLPMQWWLTGEVTWSASRRLSLAFMPILATGMLGVLSLTLEPRPGQEDLALPALIGLGITFVAIQLAHFWMIAKTLCKGAG